MSDSINQSRRNLIKYGILGGISLVVGKLAFADNRNAVESDNSVPDKINQIISVRIWPSEVYTRLTIEAKEEIKVKYFALTDPNRFVIDIYDSSLNAVLKALASNHFDNDQIISEIKVGQNTATRVRIVVYLRQQVVAQTQSIDPVHLESVDYKYRYIFDMYPVNQAPQANDGGSVDLNDDLLALLQLNAVPNSKVAVQAQHSSRGQKHPVLLPAPSAKSQRTHKGQLLVMIDPGHGGEDPGAIGRHGTKEKHVVLDIGKRLYALINAADNMRAQMTRTQDIFIPLATRVAIARKARADIFVSIHADAFTVPQARGSSVFVLSENGASSAFAKSVAASQNNADSIGGMSFKTSNSIVSRILLDMTQSYTMHKSAKLGQTILAQLKSINHLHSPNIERAGFAVLKALDIPSILVESAFVSNPAEEALLNTDAFRQKVAQQVFDGLQVYAKKNYKLS